MKRKKNNKLYVYWYRIPGNKSNFGDEVGPYIISKLSGMEIYYFRPTKRYFLKNLFYSLLFLKPYKLYKVSELINILIGKIDVILSSGSIFDHYDLSTCAIWGSGIMSKKSHINDSKYYAVRGKYSQIRLKELGYPVPEAIGDPALLLPVVFPVDIEKKYKLGIIPHYFHYETTRNMIDNEEILIIDVTDKIETIIYKINSCECICASALHGIIVSHAYKIPCLWYQLYGTPLIGDNTKFYDYFSSVGIKEYNPFTFPINSDKKEIIIKVSSKIKSEVFLNSIQCEIKILQSNLLKAAPFPIREEFLNYRTNSKSFNPETVSHLSYLN